MIDWLAGHYPSSHLHPIPSYPIRSYLRCLDLPFPILLVRSFVFIDLVDFIILSRLLRTRTHVQVTCYSFIHSYPTLCSLMIPSPSPSDFRPAYRLRFVCLLFNKYCTYRMLCLVVSYLLLPASLLPQLSLISRFDRCLLSSRTCLLYLILILTFILIHHPYIRCMYTISQLHVDYLERR